ncbi:hypothetical protein [Falsiroseomonas oryziterrae]|uniref:hypothetical protein n=1 Tax=Falsiroseomonas oryziterrae TaxID=2911368 RepID=UPI001F18E8DC|nr:hypothetical protein [Roseomonas sp. NPKOSM-4]
MSEIENAERRAFRAALLQAMRETVADEPDPARALNVLETELGELLEGPPLADGQVVEEMRVRATLAADLHAALDALRSPVARR